MRKRKVFPACQQCKLKKKHRKEEMIIEMTDDIIERINKEVGYFNIVDVLGMLEIIKQEFIQCMVEKQ